MAKKQNKTPSKPQPTSSKPSKSDIRAAASVAKKVVPKSARRKFYQQSGLSKAMPYILVLLGLILAICQIAVKFIDEDAAGIVGEIVHMVFCGFLGGGAFLLPLLMVYAGAYHVVFGIKWRMQAAKEADEAEFIVARRRLNAKTFLACLFVFLASALLGVLSAENSYDFAELWEQGAKEFYYGGIIGGSIGFLLNAAFKKVISSIILIICLAVILFFAVGLTPGYIAEKIRMRKEAREAEFEVELNNDKYEKMRAKELEKARKRKLKELEEQRKRELASATGYPEEEPTLQPPPALSRAKKQEKASRVNDEELDRFTEELDMPEDIERFDDPEPQPIEIKSEEPIAEPDRAAAAEEAQNVGRDFGGDPTLDGETFTVEDLLADIESVKNEADTAPKRAVKEKAEEELALGEISNEALAEDLSGVAPDEADGEEEEEIVLPYMFPPIEMLAPNQNPEDTDCQAELQENARRLMETLKSFKVDIKEINYSRGPTITRYELRPEVGTRVRSIANLVDDIALSLATSGVRIEAPIPNKPAVGIEVPNRVRSTVYLRDLIENAKFTDPKSRLTSCLGMDVGGNPVYFDIGKMPHLLIAGTTGSGKSVCINTIILSILYKARPDEVKLILIDPKQVEFTVYENIPHLYCPIVSEPKKAAGALASAVSEMERRFELIKSVGVRNIEGYNEVTADDPEKEYMPKMVIIIDELADLMMTARDEVETSICRIAQKARAAGIHIILGTQRPSVDVITGLIKANVPSRIACTVTSQVDSRTIIDVGGAENLIGYGDMLFAPVGAAKPMRVQGAFVSDGEVEQIVGFIKENNGTAKYNSAFITSMEENAKLCGVKKGGGDADVGAGSNDGGDSKFSEAVKLAIEEGKISTSLMQRKLGVGYGRAAKIIDSMEEMGYVSKPDGNKPRRVLITMQEYMDRVADGSLGGEE